LLIKPDPELFGRASPAFTLWLLREEEIAAEGGCWTDPWEGGRVVKGGRGGRGERGER